MNMEIPKKHIKIVGTKQKFSGGLFSSTKLHPEEEFFVLGIRWGSAKIINFKELKETGESSYVYPTIEYLLKNDNMPKSRWTRGFPVREINLKNKEAKNE